MAASVIHRVLCADNAFHMRGQGPEPFTSARQCFWALAGVADLSIRLAYTVFELTDNSEGLTR